VPAIDLDGIVSKQSSSCSMSSGMLTAVMKGLDKLILASK